MTTAPGRKPDIICLSSQDWTDVWTRKQRFMQRMARRGHRVLYVNLQASWASATIIKADWLRPFRWLAGPRKIEDNLYVGTLPLALPGFQMSLAVNAANNIMNRWVLRRWLRQLGFDAPVVWTYNPYSSGVVGRLGETCAIYECVDEFSASHGLVRAEVVSELERRLIRAVDAVIVTHPNLYESKRQLARRISLVPNAAEIEHFARAADPALPLPPDMASFVRPVIGFIGTLQYWIDFELFRFLAEKRPEWSFVLVGPVGRLARIDVVEGLKNVHILGRRRYQEMPAYAKAFDVCLNPYILDDTALNCSPLKLYEYLAAGKPVVSVDMPEARQFQGVVGIGRTYDEILTRIEEALTPDAQSDQATRVRMAAVATHSWEHRFQDMERALNEALAARSHSSESSIATVFSAAPRHE